MIEEQVSKTLKKFEFLANVIPKEKWGFQPDLLEDLRKSKQTIVNEMIPNSVLKGLSLRQKIRMGHRLGPKTDTVLDIFNWAAKSDFADSGMPKIMTPIVKQPANSVKKTAEQTEEETKIAKILSAKGVKPRNGATSVVGPPAAKKIKVVKAADSTEEEDVEMANADEEKLSEADSSDEDMEVDESDDDVAEVNDGGEKVVEVDELSDSEEEEQTSKPANKKTVFKKTVLPAKPALKAVSEVEENSAKPEKEEKNKKGVLTTGTMKVMDKRGVVETESSNATSDEKCDDADSNKSLDGSAEEDEEEKKTVRVLKTKNTKPSKSSTEAKLIKTDGKGLFSVTEPETEDFDFSLLQNSLNESNKVDKKKKKTKTEKRDSFKGRDYKSLLKKVENREKRLEKVREKNCEAAVAVEANIKFNKALKQASGEKVKDNPELLKKGIKRKEKQKEVRAKKWKKRISTVKKAQADRQAKRTVNIQKRKDAKKEHKIKRAKKRVKA